MDFLHSAVFWQYLSIPIIAAIIGWSTNWLAIELTFKPLEFIGIKPFGWQGIIPSKAAKMAAKSVDATISKIGTVREVFDQIDPALLAVHLIETYDPRIEEFVDEIMQKEYATLWENLPQAMRNMVYERVRKAAPAQVDKLVAEVSENIESLLDIKQMVIDMLVADKSLLNRIFLECGANEFRFIIISGLWLGLLFGVIQMGVWSLWQYWWVLPVCGLIVGWATNWIALNVIFRPLEPVKIGPFTVQGLFLRRQKQVAQSFTHIVTHEILTIGNIIRYLLSGPEGERTRAMIRKHVKPLVDETAGLTKPLTQLAMGPNTFASIRQKVGDKAVEISGRAFNSPVFNAERANVVAGIMQERMEALSPAEFQDLLRPCFQEDEIRLIIVGAVLGFLAGLAQVVFVFDWTF